MTSKGWSAGGGARGGTTWTVDASEGGQRLDKFLAAAGRAGSRSRAGDALARGRVFLNDAELSASGAARLVSAGDVVRLWMDRPGSAGRVTRPSPRGGFEIVHEDDDLVVVNKPAGLLTVPLDGESQAASVLDQLQERFRSHSRRSPLVVHRIDRDTSGLVMFALNGRARAALAAQFVQHSPERVYLAVVHGRPDPLAGTWHDRLIWDEEACLQREALVDDPRARDALSDYALVEAFKEASLLEVRLQTGRQGQIRVQAQLRGHSLVGDRRYGDRTSAAARTVTFPRQALHASRLVLDHPADGRRLEVTAPPPDDFRKLLATLRQQR